MHIQSVHSVTAGGNWIPWGKLLQFAIQNKVYPLAYLVSSVYYPCFVSGLVYSAGSFLPFVKLSVSLHFLMENPGV